MYPRVVLQVFHEGKRYRVVDRSDTLQPHVEYHSGNDAMGSERWSHVWGDREERDACRAIVWALVEQSRAELTKES